MFFTQLLDDQEEDGKGRIERETAMRERVDNFGIK